MINNGIPQRMDAKGWKEKGNELFKAGKFNDAIYLRPLLRPSQCHLFTRQIRHIMALRADLAHTL